MRILCLTGLLLILGSSSFGASFHWVDRQGFHSLDQVTKVPLEHRRDLPVARNGTAFPFTEEEDRDGAMYVWFTLGNAGLVYQYLKAAQFPTTNLFAKVDGPGIGDVAWWKGFVALYQGTDELLTSKGKVSLKALEKQRGRVTWYHYAAVPPEQPPAAAAPPAALKKADGILHRLDRAASYPPEFASVAEGDLLRKEWKKKAALLEGLRKAYPDDPQLLRRIGIFYRIGYNLGLPEAWDRAEAFLLRAAELAPAAPDPFISLGILYADSSAEYAVPAEKQFRKALLHARKDQLPQIWWGLSLALSYQGRTKEAVETIDKLIARHPKDIKAQNLRKTFLESK